MWEMMTLWKGWKVHMCGAYFLLKSSGLFINWTKEKNHELLLGFGFSNWYIKVTFTDMDWRGFFFHWWREECWGILRMEMLIRTVNKVDIWCPRIKTLLYIWKWSKQRWLLHGTRWNYLSRKYRLRKSDRLAISPTVRGESIENTCQLRV